MSGGPSSGEFDRLVTEALQALAPTADPGGGPAADPLLRGAGEALDGLVRAVVKPGGEVESLTVNPRALRSDLQTVADEIVLAVNAALADLRDKLAAAAPELPGPSALAERLREVQDSSVRRMETFLQSISEVSDRINQGPRADG
jgi:hypothetical protein